MCSPDRGVGRVVVVGACGERFIGVRVFFVASSWHFTSFHDKDAWSNNPQTTRNLK
jgi:hypothetical protein